MQTIWKQKFFWQTYFVPTFNNHIFNVWLYTIFVLFQETIYLMEILKQQRKIVIKNAILFEIYHKTLLPIN